MDGRIARIGYLTLVANRSGETLENAGGLNEDRRKGSKDPPTVALEMLPGMQEFADNL